MIDQNRTKQNLQLIDDINRYGYPVEVLQLMYRWTYSRDYIQLRLFK